MKRYSTQSLGLVRDLPHPAHALQTTTTRVSAPHVGASLVSISDDVEAEAFGKQMTQERWHEAASELGVARTVLRFLR